MIKNLPELRIYACCLLIVASAASSAGGCRKRAEAPPRSPDGALAIYSFVNDGRADPKLVTLIGFEVRDDKGAVHVRRQTIASDRMRWRMGWDADGRVWLNSRDIGYLCWVRKPGSMEWEKVENAMRHLPIPDSVKLD